MTKLESAQATASMQSVVPTLTSLFELHNGISYLKKKTINALQYLEKSIIFLCPHHIRNCTSRSLRNSLSAMPNPCGSPNPSPDFTTKSNCG